MRERAYQGDSAMSIAHQVTPIRLGVLKPDRSNLALAEEMLH